MTSRSAGPIGHPASPDSTQLSFVIQRTSDFEERPGADTMPSGLAAKCCGMGQSLRRVYSSLSWYVPSPHWDERGLRTQRIPSATDGQRSLHSLKASIARYMRFE